MKKRSIALNGHRTSIALEDVFWRELEKIAKAEPCSLPQLIARLDKTRKANLSSTLRVFVMENLLKQKN